MDISEEVDADLNNKNGVTICAAHLVSLPPLTFVQSAAGECQLPSTSQATTGSGTLNLSMLHGDVTW